MSDSQPEKTQTFSDLSPEELKKFAFYNLVKKDEKFDVVGFIAYALYKKSKIEYIVNYKKTHGGNSPSQEELTTVQDSRCGSTAVESSRAHATNILKVIINNILENELKVIQTAKATLSEAINNVPQKLSCPHKEAPWYYNFAFGCSQSVMASFIVMALCILIITQYDKGADLVKFLMSKIVSSTTTH